MATGFKVIILNEKALLKAWRSMPEAITKALISATRKAGVFGVGEVKFHISSGTDMYRPPVLTGAMRRGIQIAEKKPLEVVIRPSTATPYAKYVHTGTSRMPARPFFDITAQRSKEKISEFFNKEIEMAIRKTIR